MDQEERTRHSVGDAVWLKARQLHSAEETEELIDFFDYNKVSSRGPFTVIGTRDFSRKRKSERRRHKCRQLIKIIAEDGRLMLRQDLGEWWPSNWFI